jgi:hypothetical protein
MATSTPSSSSNSSDTQTQTVTPADLRAGIKLNAGPDVVTVKVTGIQGRPRNPSK